MAGFVRPNIIMIYVDQQPWDTVLVNRSAAIQVPALTQFAAKGTAITHCFNQHLDGARSFFSVMSGRYHPEAGADPLLLPAILRRYGYCSGIFGMLPPGISDADPALAAFDQAETFTQLDGENVYTAFLRQVSPEALALLQGALRREGLPAEDEGEPDCMEIGLTPSGFALARTADFVQHMVRSGQRFLCVMAASAFQWPRIMPRKFLETYDPLTLAMPLLPPQSQEPGASPVTPPNSGRRCQAWYAAISEIDHRVAALMGLLGQLRIAQNTLVIYLGARGIWCEEFAQSNGLCLPDYACRVPLLMRGPPASVGAAKVCSSTIESVDLLPTILELLAMPVPSQIQGRSFGAALRGESESHRTSALTELPGRRFLRTEFFRYAIDQDSNEAIFDLTKPDGPFHDVLPNLHYRGAAVDHRLRLLAHLLQQR